MKQSIARLTLLAFTCAALASAPIQSQAQITNKVPAEKKAASQAAEPAKSEKSAKGGPFHGKLAAVDKAAKTIVVGKRTFQITSETRIKKAGKPATLDEGVVGETVSGYVKPGTDGKLVATTVNFGPKATTQKSEKTRAGSETEGRPKQGQSQ